MPRCTYYVVLAILLMTSVADAQTHAIRGVVLDRSGTKPVVSASIRIVDVFADTCHPQNTFFSTTGPGGTIHFDLPPSVYVFRFTVSGDVPEPIYLKVDTRSGPVTDLVVRAGTRTPYASDAPPVASRISVSEPDANNMVTVRGEPGAVASSAFVVVITQETGHHAAAEASEDGSFTAAIYAPRGHSLIVRQDLTGIAWQRTRATECPDGTAAAAMEGTTVFTAPAPSTNGVPFSTGSSINPLPLYEFSGTIDRSSYAAGQRVLISGTLTVIARAVDTTSPLVTYAHVQLENLSGAGQRGARARNQFTSNLVTPTGLAIEHGDHAPSRASGTEVPLTRISEGRATGAVTLSLDLPADLAPGYYRPFVLFENTIPATPGEHNVFQISDDRHLGSALMPIIRVGSASPPRVPVSLLMDRYSNATLGLRALEDREHFGVASRVATQADDFTVPRIDALSGETIRYRLEPFLPSIMLGDRGRVIEPALIPFKLPSGSLRVVITSPDGTSRTIGPAPIAQTRLAAVVDRDGQMLGAGHPAEVLQLTTLDPAFEVAFVRNGVHRVHLEMKVEDVWGTTWSGEGTFDLRVGRPLAIDTAMLPGTPLEAGDSLALGATLIPPVPAEVQARVTLVPHSDRARTRQWTRVGKANAFGYAHLESVTFDEPGEYRVDMTAVDRGSTFSGARTWGSVVAPRSPSIVAHGMRAIDDVPYTAPRPQWFFRKDLQSTKGPSHVPFPFSSGDVSWQEGGDSAVPILTFQDVGGTATSVLRGVARFEDLASGETVPFIFRSDGQGVYLDPSRVDAWIYSYTSVQRPLVRVREEIFDRFESHGYWRFHEQYAAQAGVGRSGDAPNDFKFQFGGLVMRGPLFPVPLYAIYGSLFVLVADQNDPGGGTRTFPPFQGNPGGQDGGPLFILKGRDIDLFLHPTGLRPGSVLQRGETAAIAGYVAPPLDAQAFS